MRTLSAALGALCLGATLLAPRAEAQRAVAPSAALASAQLRPLGGGDGLLRRARADASRAETRVRAQLARAREERERRRRARAQGAASGGSVVVGGMGDAFGYGGLGAVGTGWGGGGTGEGTVGLGSMGGSAGAPSAAAPAGGGVTNTQEHGVDEGDIVKAHGEHLVILRRGRLFTVRLGAAGLEPVAAVDAFAPGAHPASWYDEMLVSGDTVAVLGYGYASRETEVNLFRIDAAGALSFQRSVYLRSGDYYSSRNYATRLVGSSLVVYAPGSLYRCEYTEGGEQYHCETTLPSVRVGARGPWRALADGSRVFDSLTPQEDPTLHTILRCDLSRAEVPCTSEGVLGPSARSFYVSPTAVYLWLSNYAVHGSPVGSVAFRFPFDGSAPGAVKVSGAPADQLAFSERNGELRVLLSFHGAGEGMWNSAFTDGPVRMARLPLASFTLEAPVAPVSAYERVLEPARDDVANAWGYRSVPLRERWVGDRILYGLEQASSRPGWPVGTLYSYDASTRTAGVVPLPHAVQRIEPLGADALVVGPHGRDLHFTSVALDATPRVASQLVQASSAQGDDRTHGFFYLPSGPRAGVLGLPTRGPQSAGVRFLSVRDLQLASLGSLDAAYAGGQPSDQCRASCADWYGNARPLFYRGRVFALLGYELVEGRVEGDALRELTRSNFTPHR